MQSRKHRNNRTITVSSVRLEPEIENYILKILARIEMNKKEVRNNAE